MIHHLKKVLSILDYFFEHTSVLSEYFLLISKFEFGLMSDASLESLDTFALVDVAASLGVFT